MPKHPKAQTPKPKPKPKPKSPIKALQVELASQMQHAENLKMLLRAAEGLADQAAKTRDNYIAKYQEACAERDIARKEANRLRQYLAILNEVAGQVSETSPATFQRDAAAYKTCEDLRAGIDYLRRAMEALSRLQVPQPATEQHP